MYFIVKEKGKEILVKSNCPNTVELKSWIKYCRKQYDRKYKNCDYKVKPFELNDVQMVNYEYLLIINPVKTDIEI